MTTFPPTAEQSHIHDLFRTGDDIKVRAGAGTGKTTTLLQLADILKEQGRIGLYLAFNKSIAQEAGRKFPRGVITASTAHSMAYRGIRATRYGHLLAKMNGNQRIPFYVTERALRIRALRAADAYGHPRTLSGYQITRHVLRTVEEFCKTTDVSIDSTHVPTMVGFEAQHDLLVDAVIPAAVAAWENLLDPRGDAVAFGHSHYLKLWALERPIIGYEGAALFLDEAQDTSPILEGVLALQKHLQLVVVGDSAQSIYRFTGAIDSMRTLTPNAAEGRLTQSWRFGQPIADGANELLSALGDSMRITGNPGHTSRIDRTGREYDAILTRTNGGALEQVMDAQEAGRKVHLMSDTRYALQFCDGAEKLKAGMDAGLEDLAAFDTWADVVEHAEDAPGASDWKVLVKLIEEHGVDPLRNALSGVVEERQADVIVSTAHKAKGREWGRVLLAGDLADAVDTARKRFEESGTQKSKASLNDELMLAYVAVTRAQDVLNPGRLVKAADTASELMGVA